MRYARQVSGTDYHGADLFTRFRECAVIHLHSSLSVSSDHVLPPTGKTLLPVVKVHQLTDHGGKEPVNFAPACVRQASDRVIPGMVGYGELA